MRTIRYLIALIIYIAAIANKPQDIKWLSAKNTFVKHIKNQLLDTIDGVVIKRALTNKG